MAVTDCGFNRSKPLSERLLWVSDNTYYSNWPRLDLHFICRLLLVQILFLADNSPLSTIECTPQCPLGNAQPNQNLLAIF